MASMYVEVDDTYRTRLQKRIIGTVQEDSVREGINRIVADMCYRYVPYRTGELRSSVEVDSEGIEWTVDYARYQYYGLNMGPNIFRGFHHGVVPIILTPPGTIKHFEIAKVSGLPTLTYFASGVHSKWYEYMLNISYNRNVMNNRITYYLKHEIEER